MTPGIICTGLAAAGAARSNARKTVTVRSLRDIRPRLTVADFSACLPFARLLLAITVVAALSALRATSGLAGQHDRPVPILMYHVIAAAPAGVAYPELFVRPNDFAGQMDWLAAHGYHAVTLRQVYDYWLKGTPLPRHAIVISFDDGYLSRRRWPCPCCGSCTGLGFSTSR